MSFRAKRRRVVEDLSEKSRVHKVGVTEILRYALDDKIFIYGIHILSNTSFCMRKHPCTNCFAPCMAIGYSEGSAGEYPYHCLPSTCSHRVAGNHW